MASASNPKTKKVPSEIGEEELLPETLPIKKLRGWSR